MIGTRGNWKGAVLQNKPKLIWSHVVIWKIPGSSEPSNISPAGYGMKCHHIGHPSPTPECPLGVVVNSVPIPALGGTPELEAGGVVVQVAKKRQSISAQGYFYALNSS